jgi:IS605 OrfB family transposase
LDNTAPARPSRKVYQGDPLITVGIGLSRQMPLTACVVDIRTGNVLESQTAKRLLSIQTFKVKQKNRSAHQIKRAHWRLVNKLHLRRQQNTLQRQYEQTQDAYREGDDESNLGAYTERLIANRVVKLAMKWNAGSIVVPDLKNIREVIESNIQASAQKRFPHMDELQKQYCKDLRASYHRWSYARLVQYIRDRAALFGISVITGQQPKRMSMQDSASHVAMSGHQLPSV